MTDIERLRGCAEYIMSRPRGAPMPTDAAELNEVLSRIDLVLNDAADLLIEAADEIERLRAALTRLTTDITSSAAAMDAVSLSIFEDALAALGEKP